MTDHADLSVPYWEGARRGVLVIQRCAACGTPRHYPRSMCASCYSFDTDHVEHPGRGTVHSWTVAHHPFAPEYADDVPYVLATVDLGEGIRALGRLQGEPSVGLAVQVSFAPDAHGEPMPVLTPVD